MAQAVGALRVDLSASHAQFKADMGKARGHVQREGRAMSSAMGKVRKSFDNTIKSIGMMAGAYVGLYAGIRAIKTIITEAANYETSLVNMAKVTGQSFEKIDKTIKGIGPEIGNYTDLMKGYYQTISAGVTNPKKALLMLVAASKLAKVAGIEQGETVKALTKVMMGYGGEVKTAADAADLLLAIEKKGQTQVSELVPVIGKLATISKMSGLSAEDMGGSLAVLTQTAGSTAEAADMLSAALTTLIKPTPAMTKEFEEFGGAINFIKEAGFEEWLKRIQKASGGTQEALTQMLGGKKNASLAIASLLMHMDTLNKDITEMKNRTGKAATAWEEYEKTSNAALDKFKNNIHNLNIVLGTALLPTVNDVVNRTSDWVKQNEKLIGQKFDEYVKGTVKAIKDLIELYNTLPAGSVDAGIIGLILAGKYGPLKLAALILTINNVMHKLGRGVQDIAEDSKDASNAMQKMWEAIIGKRDWNTGELKSKLSGAGRSFARDEPVGDKGGGGGLGGKEDDIGDTTEYYKEQAKLWNQVTKDMIVADSVLWDQWTDDQLDAIDKTTQARLDYEEQRWEGMKAGYDAEYQLMQDVEDGIKESLESIANKGEDSFDKLKQTIEGWGRDSADAITKFALTGEMTFSDMVDSMIQDLIRMMIYQKITGPLFGSISGLFSSAKGNAFQGGKVLPFAKGGIVTHPTIFPMAQGAGLMGEAGPEAVLPLKRDAGGNLGVAGGNPIINIYNNVGADIKTSERKTAGGMELDVFIDQAVAKKLGQFGSNSNKAMRQNFGASQRLTGR